MRISDWSSDVCSSDLEGRENVEVGLKAIECGREVRDLDPDARIAWVMVELEYDRHRVRGHLGEDRADDQQFDPAAERPDARREGRTFDGAHHQIATGRHDGRHANTCDPDRKSTRYRTAAHCAAFRPPPAHGHQRNG